MVQSSPRGHIERRGAERRDATWASAGAESSEEQSRAEKGVIVGVAGYVLVLAHHIQFSALQVQYEYFRGSARSARLGAGAGAGAVARSLKEGLKLHDFSEASHVRRAAAAPSLEYATRNTRNVRVQYSYTVYRTENALTCRPDKVRRPEDTSRE